MAEKRKYSADLPLQPPEDIVDWCIEQGELHGNYLVYKMDSYIDPLTEMKVRAVKLKCSYCNDEQFVSKLEKNCCAGKSSSSASYGFYHPEFNDAVISGDTSLCMSCGEPVKIVHTGSMSNHKYGDCVSSSYPATVIRLEDKLVIIGWWIRKYINKNAKVTYLKRRYEAYVIEDRKIIRYTSVQRNIGGHMVYLSEWQERKKFSDEWGFVDLIYPWDKRILIGSTAENSKLDILFKQTRKAKVKAYPITYLKIWKRRPQIENLIMQGASVLLSEMMHHQNKTYYRTNDSEVPKNQRPYLGGIDWNEKEPAKLLGMTKPEFNICIKNKWDKETYEFWKAYKSFSGRGLTVADLKQAKKFNYSICKRFMSEHREDCLKVMKYLDKQKRKDKRADHYILIDYWRIASDAGKDLTIPIIRYPSNLMHSHDRAEEERQRLKREIEQELAKERQSFFEARFEMLKIYQWEASGLIIFPARNEDEMINDGKVLNTCISSYAKDHANGTKSIFFIRKAKASDKPFFTLELNEKELSIVQNRGKANCAATAAVDAFAKAWITEIKNKRKLAQSIKRKAKSKNRKPQQATAATS